MCKSHHCSNKTNGKNQLDADWQVIRRTINSRDLKEKKTHNCYYSELNDKNTTKGSKKNLCFERKNPCPDAPNRDVIILSFCYISYCVFPELGGVFLAAAGFKLSLLITSLFDKA